jgi:hypothetical protein
MCNCNCGKGNVSIPKGPKGDTGPAGPPGPGGVCCVTRVLNDTTTIKDEGALNIQVLNLSLEEDGQFVEVNFDTSFIGISDFGLLILDLNGYLICDIAINSDISAKYRGTITITQASSTTVNIKTELFGYGIVDSIINLELSNKNFFGHKLDHPTTPDNLVLTISTASSFVEDPENSTILNTYKILKYNLPYII